MARLTSDIAWLVVRTTTLQGTVASGQRVTGDIGGQLRIDSLQDSSRYDSRQQNAGVSIAAGTGSASGSISAGNTRIDSDYLNVAEQSGLKAGDGGFQLTVKGDTPLSGGVIASSDVAVQAGVNRLDTTATHLSDLHNQASYKASGYSVNVGVSSGKPSGSAASDTRAGISGIAGNSSVRSGDAETGIANPFDAQRVAANVGAQVAITAEFGRQAPRAWADFAQAQSMIGDVTLPAGTKMNVSVAGGISPGAAKGVVTGDNGGGGGVQFQIITPDRKLNQQWFNGARNIW
ncbi:hemagglutinin repeat-containing protein [Vogesella urethralis]|uniref:hemagglutinin repeat-containing protein n=1 Tax=Vogesella urethralis TaxID=2592656 RepID=UPI0011854129|nr:hemagglutinin repeat-containing protein [Vogesella urethralis]